MKTIKLIDHTFGEYTNIHGCPLMRWQRLQQDPNPEDSVVYTQIELQQSKDHQARRKIAWLLESRAINWWCYEYLENNMDDFDIVLTHDESLIARRPDRYFFVPRGGLFIYEEDWRLYDKSRMVSFIASDKGFDIWYAPGHGLRHDLFKIIKEKGGLIGSAIKHVPVDCYGSITGTRIPYKLSSLQDYMFQISIENMSYDTYFTEKVLDCFITGTVPIYRVTRLLSSFFNEAGIIYFDTLEQLARILKNLTPEDYYHRVSHSRQLRARQAFSVGGNLALSGDQLSGLCRDWGADKEAMRKYLITGAQHSGRTLLQVPLRPFTDNHQFEDTAP